MKQRLLQSLLRPVGRAIWPLDSMTLPALGQGLRVVNTAVLSVTSDFPEAWGRQLENIQKAGAIRLPSQGHFTLLEPPGLNSPPPPPRPARFCSHTHLFLVFLIVFKCSRPLPLSAILLNCCIIMTQLLPFDGRLGHSQFYYYNGIVSTRQLFCSKHFTCNPRNYSEMGVNHFRDRSGK